MFKLIKLLLILGATLEIITDKSQEGAQFVRGFGGIGGEKKPCLHQIYSPTD